MTRFTFVDREKAFYPVNLLCQLLNVSRSGFYAWKSRPPSKRRLADEVLAEQIGGSYQASRNTYGAPGVHEDLVDAGVRVGRKRVARIMREHGWQGVHRRSWRHLTQADSSAVPAPDLLDRDFRATAVDQKWVDFNSNRIWCVIVALARELTAWLQMLALAGARGAVGVGETVVGEVGLPALVGHSGLESDVGGLRPLLRLRDHQPESRQVAADRGHGHGDLMMVLQVPRDGVWPGIKASIDQFLAEPDDQFDGGIADGARSGFGPT